MLEIEAWQGLELRKLPRFHVVPTPVKVIQDMKKVAAWSSVGSGEFRNAVFRHAQGTSEAPSSESRWRQNRCTSSP